MLVDAAVISFLVVSALERNPTLSIIELFETNWTAPKARSRADAE
jgi:hypothetical protein